MLVTKNLPGMVAPPLKWAGGKRWLVPTLLPIWERFAGYRLVEPFVGGMAVALGIMPAQAVLNDTNPHVINFYRWLQRGLENTLSMANDADCYYQHRTYFNQLVREGQADTAEAASLFYYLNRTGYNGLCRFNRSGAFNVPFGRYKTINYTLDWSGYQTVLADWTFTSGDFAELAIDKFDLIYADPPYDVPFTTYSAGGFSWHDQQRLATWLAAQPGPVIASNQATPRMLELYRDAGFEVQQLPAPRRISCTGDRAPAAEMLAYKLP